MLVEDLHKRYGDKVAVDGVSFAVEHGEIFGVLGPNGAGKTTTVESIAGLRIGERGRVRVLGLDPWRDRDAVVPVLGIQLQESRLQPKITVREAIELWSAFYTDPTPWPALAERLGMTEHLDRRFALLSGGQQQRLSIALALVGNPQVVILDELTTGLDPRARRDVWQLVREVRDSGVTVLLVTHSMEEAQQLCDRIAIIDGGRVRALDTPDGLIRAGGSASVVSFQPSAALDLEAVRLLDDVVDVRLDGDRVVVEGADDVALAILGALAAQGVVPTQLRVAAGSLDTAYLDLTRQHDLSEEPA